MDDDPHMLRIAGDLLTAEGFEVTTVADPKEALPRPGEILAGRERDRVFRSAVNTAVRQIKQ